MSAFLEWIAAQMAGEPGLGDADDLWDEPGRHARDGQPGLMPGTF